MESLDKLISILIPHLLKPQKSERWSMYRLIVPIVDFANTSMNMEPYFEFNQTSAHNTSQSVDIALLDHEKPKVMIEAKRANRNIAPENIEKYLDNGVRGVVTNGFDWVLCHNSFHIVQSIWNNETNQVKVDSLESIINFIRGKESHSSGWSKGQTHVVSNIRPISPVKLTKAVRLSNKVTAHNDIEECRIETSKLTTATSEDIAFIVSLIDSIHQTYGNLPSGCRCEFRASRVSFFNDSAFEPSRRVGRIELGRKNPDVIILTRLVASANSLNSITPPRPHDKGPHMRRYRLPDVAGAENFGRELGPIIFSDE